MCVLALLSRLPMTSLVPLSQKPRIIRIKYKKLDLLFDAASLNILTSFLSLQGAYPPVIWLQGVEQIGSCGFIIIGFLSLGFKYYHSHIAGMNIQVRVRR